MSTAHWSHRLSLIGIVLAALSGAVDAVDRSSYVAGNYDYIEPTITAEKARELAASEPILTLSRVKTVSQEVAENLVSNERGFMLSLPAVEELDIATARELSRFKGRLRLWGVPRITPDVARVFAENMAGEDLDLSGLSDCSIEVAEILATTKTPALWLGLREIDVPLARALVPLRGHLIFPDLETLSPEAAAELAKHKGPLNLGRAKLSKEAATALLAHNMWLSLPYVKRLEPGVGDILAQRPNWVTLSLEEIDSIALARKLLREPNASGATEHLRTISPEIARELVQSGFRGGLGHLERLSPDAARELAKHDSDIIIRGSLRLTADSARALTNRQPRVVGAAVHLDGVEFLEGPDAVAIAEALASTPGEVSLKNLKRISAPALAALKKKPAIKLPPAEKLTVVP